MRGGERTYRNRVACPGNARRNRIRRRNGLIARGLKGGAKHPCTPWQGAVRRQRGIAISAREVDRSRVRRRSIVELIPGRYGKVKGAVRRRGSWRADREVSSGSRTD